MHNIAVTIQEPTQVTSCCNLLAPVRQLSFNSRSARMSQVQRVFIAEHYLASRSYLPCQNEFRDTFLDSPVSNKPTISRLVNRFRDTGTLHRVASNMRKRVNACIAERWTFPTLKITLKNVSGMGCVTFRSSCICRSVQIMELLQFSPPFRHFIPLGSKYSQKNPFLKHPQ
jgi:hypothetical protein